jgi:hypothetical protein
MVWRGSRHQAPRAAQAQARSILTPYRCPTSESGETVSGLQVINLYTLYVLYPFSKHFLYAFSMHSLYILYTFSIHSLYILCTFSVHSPSILYTFSIRSLYIHYTFSYVLYTFSIHSLYVLYTFSGLVPPAPLDPTYHLSVGPHPPGEICVTYHPADDSRWRFKIGYQCGRMEVCVGYSADGLKWDAYDQG